MMILLGSTLGGTFTERILMVIVWGGSIGVVSGMTLGLVLRDWRSIVRLILAGFIGFSIGLIICVFWLGHVIFPNNVVLQAIGGASVGAAFGFMKNDMNLDKQNRSR